jgi:signal peptidase I
LPLANIDKHPQKERQDQLGNSRNFTRARYIAIGITIAVVAFLIIITYSNLGALNPFYVVISESMVPSLNVGDIVIINRGVPFSSLNVGDIIVFTTPGKTTEGTHKTIVHRISGIEIHGNHATIMTKGDANPLPIELMDYPIKEQNYIGKVAFTIPKLGLLSTLLR